MLDELLNPVTLSIRLPGLGVTAVVEVEREIVEFFGDRTAEGFSFAGTAAETPSEWFLARLQRFVADIARDGIEEGADTMTAVSEAVVAASAYAAPAYYVGRALELVAAEAVNRNETLAQLTSYLRAHPRQRDRLSQPTHVAAVPAIRADLTAILRRSRS